MTIYRALRSPPKRRRGLILCSAGQEREQLHLGLKSVIFALRTPKLFEFFKIVLFNVKTLNNKKESLS